MNITRPSSTNSPCDRLTHHNGEADQTQGAIWLAFPAMQKSGAKAPMWAFVAVVTAFAVVVYVLWSRGWQLVSQGPEDSHTKQVGQRGPRDGTLRLPMRVRLP